MKYEFGMVNSEFGMPPTRLGACLRRAWINSEFRIPNSELNDWVGSWTS